MIDNKNYLANCKDHNSKAIQIGWCISCSSSSAICKAKNCIKGHTEN